MGAALCRATVLAAMILARSTAAGPSPSSYSIQQVTFCNGPILLAGRLYLPLLPVRAPAVVFTHGSGNIGKDNPRLNTEAIFLAENGLAVLLYDKRGVGGSGGDWRTANFRDLASDAAAAFEYLRSRHEIAGDKIGFRGASQAGYVLPIAATLVQDPAYLVLLSPPMVTPEQQILYNVEAELRANSAGSSQIAEALDFTRAGLEFARTGKNWETYARRLPEAKKQPWFALAGGPDSPDDWMFAWLRKILDFDPLPFLRSTSCPVLVFFAGHDTETPVDEARRLIEPVLTNRAASRIVSYPDANHDLRVVDGPFKGSLGPGYLETLRDWIRQVSEER